MVTTVVGELMTEMLYPYWKVPPMHAEHTASSSDLLGSCRKNREKAKKTKKKPQKKQKTKQRQTVKFNIKKTNIFFQLNTYFVFCQRTCIRSLSLISLTSRGWYSSINSLGILLLALCSMCAPIGLLLSRHSKSLSRRNKAAGYLNVTGSWVSHEGYTIRMLSSQTSVVRG